MKIIAILNQVAEILQDTASVTWTQAQLIRALNTACKMVCNYRPDAHTAEASVTLVEGTGQDLPATAQRLIDVLYNGDSDSPGTALRLVDKKTKDQMEPGWHSEQKASTFYEVVYDERTPKRFFVSPPANDTSPIIRVVVSTVPTDIADNANTATTDFPLIEKYAPMVQEFMLYLAMSRDSERTPNGQRAAYHLNNFYNMLGIKTRSDNNNSPRPRAPGAAAADGVSNA